ncbi:type II secretion system F family protein [Pseudarthrobacter sulfonivorans]|uniref:type II secretion system F family protein n=1 Tax=Pseudarthrobacter sulfonivorans TaxID=121292 RepID=UPI0028551365|nr:type II secretion system F family protein [Pseudarthrobacter sulfonivorans]MDR6413619.1 tight adherence protein B [Pseudarthrobacter sulfonivorans]
METPALFIVAIVLCFGALLVLFFLVLRPRYGAIPVDRRRPQTYSENSSFSKVSQSLVDRMGGVLGKSGGPFHRALLYNAGVKLGPADFTVLVSVVAFLAGFLGTLLTTPVIGILIGVATPFVVRLVLSIRTDRRRGKFEAQLIDTIQMLIGGLRAGHSVMRSLEAAGLESEAPTSEELTRIVNETRIGKDARQALEETAERMGSEDFRWIGQAIQINREVGGDLAEVLEQVAGTIRERSEIKGQVRSLSAEGKMSAIVLMAMPVGVALMLSVINPGYMSVFVDEPVGNIMVAVSLVMFVIGGFWMSRIVKIKF